MEIETTSFFLKFIGSFTTIVGLSLLSKKNFDKFIELEKTQSEILGMFSLIICLTIIFTHNIWTGPWEIFVSVIGWLGLLKGIGRLGIIPVYSKYRLKKMESNSSKKKCLVYNNIWANYALRRFYCLKRKNKATYDL